MSEALANTRPFVHLHIDVYKRQGSMSSFASRAREEIAQRSIQKDCCVRAAAYGIACFAKYFDAKGLGVQTEQQETVQAAQQLFAR